MRWQPTHNGKLTAKYHDVVTRRRLVWNPEKCLPLVAAKAVLPWFVGALAAGMVILAFAGWVAR